VVVVNVGVFFGVLAKGQKI